MVHVCFSHFMLFTEELQECPTIRPTGFCAVPCSSWCQLLKDAVCRTAAAYCCHTLTHRETYGLSLAA